LKIIPAIDLLGGRCVRLFKGDFDQVTTYPEEPLQRVQGYCSAGAHRIHVIDLDAARDQSEDNHATVEEIVHYTGVEVQVGGGIRSQEAAQAWFDRGASHVILGTMAVEDPAELERLAGVWPGRVYVAMDVRDGQIATHGWGQSGRTSVEEIIATFADVPLAGFIYTDIERDGTLAGPDTERLSQVVAGSRHPVIASGGISSIEHVRTVEAAGADGAIIGKALFEGELRLREVINSLAHSEGVS
jgi:phosphoribosylformimino-5-aminoimidazole carboxamide ribotide isomerase